MSERIMCKIPIYGIMFGVLLFLIGIIVFLSGTNDAEQEIKKNDKYIAGAALLMFAFIIIFISSLNAAYMGCFKTAITGTLLSLLILV